MYFHWLWCVRYLHHCSAGSLDLGSVDIHHKNLKKAINPSKSHLLLILWLGTLTFCLFVVGFVTHTCIIAIAHDSVVTAGTPRYRRSSFSTVLCRAALKTEPEGVDG